MDGGLRAPRPTERRVAAARPEQSPYRQPTVAVTDKAPVATQYAASSTTTRPAGRSWGRIVIPLVTAVIGIAIGVLGWMAWSHVATPGLAVDTSKYQAVFFTNGQVYFGKLQNGTGDYMKLTDIYYLQTQSQDADKDAKNPQQTTTDQGNVQLVKLGNEIHGPEDEMLIARDQVLFYENLKDDGKVAQSIKQHKGNNK